MGRLREHDARASFGGSAARRGPTGKAAARDCGGFTRSLQSPREVVTSAAEHTHSSGPENGPGLRATPLVVEGSRLANPVPVPPGGRPGALGAY